MDSLTAQVPSKAKDWLATCEGYLRTANYTALAALLQKRLDAIPDATKLFYQGRIAVGSANFLEAAALFQKAGREAAANNQTILQQQSLVWEAYAHVNLGNYPFAKRLIKHLESDTTVDDPKYADIYFVRSLIAAEQSTFQEAKYWMKKARTVAQRLADYWMEARCCANLAVIYSTLGQASRAIQMIRRVEKINSTPGYVPNHQQLMQVRNIHAYVLRFQGEPEEALRVAEPLPDTVEDGCRLFLIYLTLTVSAIRTELGDFKRAEELLNCARELTREVQDDDRTFAEVLWERAWLQFRQGNSKRARQDIHEALRLVNDEMDTECFHAYVIHTIIGMRSNDLSVASYSLNQANDRFRRVGHVVSLAGALLHYAAYLLTHENLRSGREALAEALTIMRNRQLYGTPYWDPLLMVDLCRKVIQEDIWGDQADSLAAHLFHIPESTVARKFELEGGPKGMWAEYATALAVRRLAGNYWREFVPLLSDPRPLVRRRAIQVLYASDSTEAKALVEPLRADPAGEAEHYFFTQKVWPVQIYSFGQTKLFINGHPLKLDKASTSKALLIFNALLLYRQYGMSSNDLGLLLWPEKSPAARSSVLQMTISNLRTALGEALDKTEGKQVIKSEQGRYYLRLPETAVWWDWQELQRISSGMPIDAHIRRAAEGLYRESFMRIFAELLPPPNLDPVIELAWERIVRSLSAMATDYEIEAEKWMATIRGRSSAWSEE